MSARAQCPVVDVTASDSVYCYSDILEFNLNGLPAGYTVEWNVGAGYDTATTTYSTTVGASGLIDVFVRFQLSDGTFCNHVQYDITRVIPQLNPDFQASKEVLCSGPDTITLFDKTNNSVSRNWIINGNPISNALQAQTVYLSQLGPTDLTLVVRDQYGCSNVKVYEDTIEVYNDIGLGIAKSNTTDFCVPYSTNFISTYTTTQSVDSQRWDLPGSGSPKVYAKNANGINYNNTGSYPVTFRVFTSGGCTYTAAQSKFVQLGDTTSLVAVAQKTEVCVSELVLFSETVKPLPGKLTWQIASDKQVVQGKYDVLASFRDTGYFDLTLIYDDLGCISTLYTDSFIKVKGIKGDFKSSSPFHCDTPFAVNFINTTDSSLGISNYLWRIRFAGNDSIYYTDTSRHITVQFDSMPALYNVELLTVDADGCRDSLRRNNFVKLESYVFDVYDIRPSIGCIGQQIRMVNKTAAGSAMGPDFYKWTYYDKNDSSILSTRTSKQGAMTYSDTGFYSFQLKMYNNFGCSDSIFVKDSIQIIDPQILYQITDTAICLGDSFFCKGISLPKKADYNYEWRFTHDSTGASYTYSGDSIHANIPQVGPYTLTVIQQIGSGCRDSVNTKVYINGVVGSIVLGESSGCSPLVLHPEFVPSMNVNPGNADSSIEYNWFIYPEAGTMLSNPNSASPEIEITGFGRYEISVFLTNASGCGNYNVESSDVQVGVEARFFSDEYESCDGHVIEVIYRKQNEPDLVTWLVEPNTDYTIDSIDYNKYHLVINDTGTFDLVLIVGKNNQCFDTLKRPYELKAIEADFRMLDSVLFCAPQSAGIIQQVYNADTFQYIFDDGQMLTSTSDTAYHVFLKNGYHGITMVAKNPVGCRDTVHLDSMLYIRGPKAIFEPESYVGCDPFEVEFMDLSEYNSSLILDFGDGTVDSNPPLQHSYSLSNGLGYQDFFPEAIARDSFGCSDTSQLDSFVRVYANPEPTALLGPDTVLCQNASLQFESNGAYVDSANWYLNGTLISTSLSDSTKAGVSGQNILKLIVFSDQACIDSAEYFYDVLPVPSLAFNADSLACQNYPYSVGISVQGPAQVEDFNWNFGQAGHPQNIQITTDSTASIDYTVAGPKKVWVRVDFLNGCSTKDSIFIRVHDPNSLIPVELEYVTVNSAGTIDLFHEGTPYFKTEQFNIYRNDSLVFVENDTSSRTWTDSKLLIGPSNYCYHITLTDACGVESPKLSVHCPVILSVSSTQHRQIDLSWTSYLGWPSVLRYEIYRSENGEPQSLLAQVPSGVNSYIDSNLCPGNFTYIIHAIKPADLYISRSNVEQIAPVYLSNMAIPDIRVVSVTETQEIEVYWPSSTYPGFDRFEVEKYENNFATPVQTFVTNQANLQDPDVNTESNSYIYEVKEFDDCDSFVGPARYGKSIVLSAQRLPTASTLSWTAYVEWQNGVDRYEVLVRENGAYTVIATVPGNQLNYLDEEVHIEDAEGRYPYRIRALNTDGDTSYSNIVYISGGPIVFIPNAFSPNGDGVNDHFSISTVFVKNSSELSPEDFHIEIYNRWGELVFESSDRDFIWAGEYLGKPVPQGVYFYIVRFTESKGFKSYGNGTVTVLR